MGMKRSNADPCLYYSWTENGLVIWVSWIDDCLVVGSRKAVEIAKKEMMERFECDDVGDIVEYVGCKIDIDKENQTLKFTQPVLLQSYEDEFELPTAVPKTPATPGSVLLKGDGEPMSDKKQTKYRSGVGKLLHMMRWSKPSIYNATRECSRRMQTGSDEHYRSMLGIMKHCVGAQDEGLVLAPEGHWDGSKDHIFRIRGMSNSDFSKNKDDRKSVSGMITFLNESVVAFKSSTQKVVALSVTEAELYAATSCAQDMLFVMHTIESLGLKVEKPMILKVENKGAVEFINNLSFGGRARQH